MSDFATEVTPINIEDELKQSYLDYAMSVIVGRALPDVRDGLKPVHRRVLYAMNELGNDYNKGYKKSARIVGDVIGKYHPHGDSAVYDAIVRMAQPFSLRYMLVDGQGNFGSVDGDNAAAMRYTEVRMQKIAHELLADLDKETVDFVPNYDGSEQMPSVMPARFPNLLVNGSSGIAVGMATNIPPHNLTEVINGCLAVIDDEEISVDDLIEHHISGPDFPTAAIINGRAGILEAYRTGRGRIYMRSRAEIEVASNGKESIIVTEIPYQVNKAKLIEKIAELVKDKKVEGITDIRDESDKDGMRIVIEVRKGDSAEVLLNNLYSLTQLETVFGINMVALDDGQPRLMNLKDIISAFVAHRREVVTRRTVFDLKKARAKGHILEGLAVALANIDEIIELIKTSANGAEAKERLLAKGWDSGTVRTMLEAAGDANACRPVDLAPQYGFREDGDGGLYHLSPVQAQAILDMKLQKLTGLEQDKLINDYQEILDSIKYLLSILGNPDLLMQIIKQELNEIKEQYGDERRTEIIMSRMDLTNEDLIADESVVVTLSHAGYAKTQLLDSYQAQRRGGKGKSATKMKEEDFVEHLVIGSMHDTLMFFTTKGKVYWQRVFELPQGSRNSRGKPIVNMLPLDEGEKVSTVLCIKKGQEHEGFLFFATQHGVVKKVPMEQFSRPRPSGLIAIGLRDDDALIDVAITTGEQDIMLFSNAGKAIRFNESDVRAMGRTAAGVRGLKLKDDQRIISLKVIEDDTVILTASANGYGKRTSVAEYKTQGRGGQGVIAMVCSDRNGEMIGAIKVTDNDEIMLISDQGTLVRTRAVEVSQSGRNTQGVRLIRLADDENLVGLARIAESDLDEGLDDDLENALENAEGTAAEGVDSAVAESDTTPDSSGQDNASENNGSE